MRNFVLALMWFLCGTLLPMVISQCAYPWSASFIYYVLSVILATSLFFSHVKLPQVWWIVPFAVVYLYIDYTQTRTLCLNESRSAAETFLNFFFTGGVLLVMSFKVIQNRKLGKNSQ